MSTSDGNELQKMLTAGVSCRGELLRQMQTSRRHSWDWSVPEFADALEWVRAHPHEVRRSVYLSDTPGKEVWLLTVPERYGGLTVVLKSYLVPEGVMHTWKTSRACVEACNYATLAWLGIRSAKVLACGETRVWGRVVSSYIVTEYLPDTIDGSALMPGGFLGDNQTLRLSFAQKTLEILATAHRCRFFHRAFHPRKILINRSFDDSIQDVTLIDVASGGLKLKGSVKKDIVKDLWALFTEIRLSSDEIKCLCNFYLEKNPDTTFDLDSLWQMLCDYVP